jgi:hypothetical protein
VFEKLSAPAVVVAPAMGGEDRRNRRPAIETAKSETAQRPTEER